MHFVTRRAWPDEMEIEFITAAAGSKGGAIEIQKGLTAQAVKFGHLLLEHTWDVELSDLTEGRMSGRLTIPTPAAFALTKSLAFPRRHDLTAPRSADPLGRLPIETSQRQRIRAGQGVAKLPQTLSPGNRSRVPRPPCTYGSRRTTSFGPFLAATPVRRNASSLDSQTGPKAASHKPLGGVADRGEVASSRTSVRRLSGFPAAARGQP